MVAKGRLYQSNSEQNQDKIKPPSKWRIVWKIEFMRFLTRAVNCCPPVESYGQQVEDGSRTAEDITGRPEVTQEGAHDPLLGHLAGVR